MTEIWGWNWDALCSQCCKGVIIVVKNLMSCGSLHGPGQIYRWKIILFLLNPCLIMLPGVVAQIKQGVTEVDKGCYSLVFPTY